MAETYTVYLATSPSGKRYVGITSYSLKERIAQHGQRARRKQRSGHFQTAICKYGTETFNWEVLHTNLSNIEACEFERKHIAEFKSSERQFGYNMTEGGEAAKHTEASRKKLSISAKIRGVTEQFLEAGKRTRFQKGVKLTGEALKKVRAAQLKVAALRSHPVACSDGREFKSVSEASRSTGLNIASILDLLKGVTKASRKLNGATFSYLNNEEIGGVA